MALVAVLQSHGFHVENWLFNLRKKSPCEAVQFHNESKSACLSMYHVIDSELAGLPGKYCHFHVAEEPDFFFSCEPIVTDICSAV